MALEPDSSSATDSAKAALEYGPAQPRSWRFLLRIEIVLPVAVLLALAVFWLVMAERYARAQSDSVRCRNNLRALGSAIRLYGNENRGWRPPSMGVLAESQDLATEVFVCPASGDKVAKGTISEERAAIDRYDGHCSYRYAATGNQFSMLPAGFVIAYELPGNHAGVTNIMYDQGNVITHLDALARKIIAEVESGHNPPRPEMLAP